MRLQFPPFPHSGVMQNTLMGHHFYGISSAGKRGENLQTAAQIGEGQGALGEDTAKLVTEF